MQHQREQRCLGSGSAGARHLQQVGHEGLPGRHEVIIARLPPLRQPGAQRLAVSGLWKSGRPATEGSAFARRTHAFP